MPKRLIRPFSSHAPRERVAILRLDRDDSFNLDRDLAGQGDVADGGAGVPAGFAEHIDEQVRAAVDDLGRIVEIRRGVDHAEELDDVVHAVERAERVAHRGEEAKADEPGSRTNVARFPMRIAYPGRAAGRTLAGCAPLDRSASASMNRP